MVTAGDFHIVRERATVGRGSLVGLPSYHRLWSMVTIPSPSCLFLWAYVARWKEDLGLNAIESVECLVKKEIISGPG
jgi:hypothetical protein